MKTSSVASFPPHSFDSFFISPKIPLQEHSKPRSPSPFSISSYLLLALPMRRSKKAITVNRRDWKEHAYSLCTYLQPNKRLSQLNRPDKVVGWYCLGCSSEVQRVSTERGSQGEWERRRCS